MKRPLARVTIGKTLGHHETILCGTGDAARFAEAFARVAIGSATGDMLERIENWTVTRRMPAVSLSCPHTDFYVRVERVQE